MRHISGPYGTAEKHIKDIRRATRKQYSSEEKIRIVLENVEGSP
jgi:transposase